LVIHTLVYLIIEVIAFATFLQSVKYNKIAMSKPEKTFGERRKMKLQRNKKTTAITLTLMLAIAMTLAAFSPTVQAIEIPTFLILSVEPDPVGVNQAVFVNAFLSKPTPTSSMGGVGDHYVGIRIEITQPDGTKKALGPYTADAVGGTWATFVPTQTGNYTFQASYPGQTLTYGTTYNGTILKPSVSATVTLVVQQDSIPTYSSPPLPNEYWSRPIYATNYEWAKLGGSWFGLATPAFATTGQYDATGNFNPYSPAPNTGHILWTKPTSFGGQVGAPFRSDQESQYTSTSILVNHWEPIVINGILYYNEYSSVDSVPKSWLAVDLRTGETLWERTPGITYNQSDTRSTTYERLRMGDIVKFHSMQEYGSFPLLYSIVGGGMFGGAATYRLYDPVSGSYLGTIGNVTTDSAYLMNFAEPNEGTLLGYHTSGGNLTMWNSTRCLAGGLSTLTLRPPAARNFTVGNQWSVPVPTTIGTTPIGGALSIAARTPEVILMRYSPNYVSQSSRGFAVEMGVNALTGQIMWGPTNRTIPEYQDVALLTARDGVFVTHNKDTNEAYGFSLTDGSQLWGPVKLVGNAWSTISRAGQIAYGMVYIFDFGGFVNALDLQTGEIKWTYTRGSAGYETPYGVYPIWQFGTHSVADGKLFFSEGHMYDPPLFAGSQRLAIDAYTGELVWSILSFSGRAPGAIADGMLVQWNSYDAQIYTFGKGQTSTSVTIQNDVVPRGNAILIKGTVMDESPGTKNPDRVARFPDGVPAVADADMSPWMEYVYMQQPKPANVTGVPVKITITDPNGDNYDVAATTDKDGKYAAMWTPQVEGIYAVTVSFEGSESYWPSQTATSFGTVAAPSPLPVTPTPTPTTSATTPPTTAPPTVSPSQPVGPGGGENTVIYVGIAAVVIIAVIAAAAIALRRRK